MGTARPPWPGQRRHEGVTVCPFTAGLLTAVEMPACPGYLRPAVQRTAGGWAPAAPSCAHLDAIDRRGSHARSCRHPDARAIARSVAQLMADAALRSGDGGGAQRTEARTGVDLAVLHGEGSTGLHGEESSGDNVEDARTWFTVYSELVAFTGDLMARLDMRREDGDGDRLPTTHLAASPLPQLGVRHEQLRRRLEFWARRVIALEATRAADAMATSLRGDGAAPHRSTAAVVTATRPAVVGGSGALRPSAGDGAPPDHAFTADVRARLVAAADGRAIIDVAVEHGVVHLKGAVELRSDVDRLVHAAKCIPGVHAVDEHLVALVDDRPAGRDARSGVDIEAILRWGPLAPPLLERAIAAIARAALLAGRTRMNAAAMGFCELPRPASAA